MRTSITMIDGTPLTADFPIKLALKVDQLTSPENRPRQ
jgi:hypothetical protein